MIRLLSKMHHTEGSPTLAGALEHLDKLAADLHISEKNVIRKPIPWSGELGITLLATLGDPMQVVTGLTLSMSAS